VPLRRIILNLHLYAGLVAALFLTILGVTGSIMVFEDQIDGWLNPQPAIRPQPERLSLHALETRLEAANAGYKVAGFGFPPRADVPLGAFLFSESLKKGVNLAVNPYTGEIIPPALHRSNFTGQVHQFHTHLLLGAGGQAVVGYAGVFLLFLSITGLVLWWPRKALTVRWRSPGVTFNLDLHSAAGIYSSTFLMLFALTGMVIHWEAGAARWISYLTPSEAEEPVSKPSTPAPGAARITPDQALATAEHAANGAKPSFMQLARGQGDAIRVVLKFPEDRTPAGRTVVLLDPHTGRILSFENTRRASFSHNFTRMWNREIHTGDILGWPTRILACIFSLSLPLMAITGPLIWWNRQRQRRANGRPSADLPNRNRAGAAADEWQGQDLA
jgi:uncharacterized iron-regulated membrane protein